MLPTSFATQFDTGISPGVSRCAPTARLHVIGSDFVMAVWESAPSRHHGRVIPSIDGVEAQRPYTLLTVPTSWGGERTLAVLRCHAGAGTLAFHDEAGQPVASASASAPTDFDAGLLMSGLD